MKRPVLYGYWRSSAAYRVRIALNLKGIEYEQAPVHLVRNGGEQHQPDYRALNPQRLVPTLAIGETVITQSLAILEYLEETGPAPALLPDDAVGRARVRSLAQIVACDVHPLQNLRVLNYLTGQLGTSDSQRSAWARHWISEGLRALEERLSRSAATGTYCHGETPGLADICLVPQLYNARRFACELDAFPTVRRIDEACRELTAFRAAAPEAQPDAA
jgi:maleylacetoacetate isomerase/maleylpyruvate isomerase